MRPRNLTKPSSDQDTLIIDTRGGKLGKITNRAWKILSITNHRTVLNGYQDKSKPRVCPIVNTATKVTLENSDEPIIVILTYFTLVSDPNEVESLLQLFSLMSHGVNTYMTPELFGGKQQLKVENHNIPMNFDGKKLFFNI